MTRIVAGSTGSVCRSFWYAICMMSDGYILRTASHTYRVTLINSIGSVQLGTQPKFACWDNNLSLSNWRTKLHAAKTWESKTCHGIHHTMTHSHNLKPHKRCANAPATPDVQNLQQNLRHANNSCEQQNGCSNSSSV